MSEQPNQEPIMAKPDPVALLAQFLKDNNLEIGSYPKFLPRDDNTFSVVVNMIIQEKPPAKA